MVIQTAAAAFDVVDDENSWGGRLEAGGYLSNRQRGREGARFSFLKPTQRLKQLLMLLKP